MARGGYRKPGGGPRAAGVGKNSQRTDAAQPIQVPNVGDSTDLTQGDRQKLEAGQRIAPIRAPQDPRFRAPAGSQPIQTGTPASLSDHVFARPSTRPDEPTTEGLSMGPGGGPERLTPPPPADDREVVLRFLVDNFQDDAANQMLSEMQRQREVPEQAVGASSPPPAGLAPTAPTEPVPQEIPLPEAPIEEVPLEEPPLV